MSIIGTIFEDVTTDVLGDIGSWQWMVTIFAALISIPTLFNEQEDMFLLRSSPSQAICIPPADYIEEVVNVTTCTFSLKNGTTILCQSWKVRLFWIAWLKKSWLVLCDDKLRLMSTALICRVGLLFGFVIFGFISDSFGRKMSFLIIVPAEFLFKLVLTYCDSESWFRLVVFLEALFSSGSLYVGIILVCEISSNRWRTCLILIAVTPRLIAMMFMVPIANCIANVATYSSLASIFELLTLVILRWVPESPQWLLYNRKIDDAEMVLLRAARRNGIRFSGEFKIRPVNHRAYRCLEQNMTCLGLFTTHNTRIIAIITLIFWCFYYFNWGYLYIRVYSQIDLSTVILEISILFCVFTCLTLILSMKLKLKILLIIHVSLTCIFTFIAVFIKEKTTSTLCASFAVSTSIIGQALMFNITPRLFAINVRATLFGCCHATGQFGVMMSYILYLLQAMNDATYLVVTGIFSIFLLLICIAFPDVDGRELPDIMEDMDYFSELSKPLRWATQKRSSPSKEERVIRVYSFGSNAGRTSINSQDPRVPAQQIGLSKFAKFLSRKK